MIGVLEKRFLGAEYAHLGIKPALQPDNVPSLAESNEASGDESLKDTLEAVTHRHPDVRRVR